MSIEGKQSKIRKVEIQKRNSKGQVVNIINTNSDQLN